MPQEVIEILSDTEQDNQLKTKQQQLLQKQLETEAALRKSGTSLMLAVNMQFIQGTAKQKQQILVQRIRKMFLDRLQFDTEKDHFCVKREPDYSKQDSKLVENQLMVFGADFWTIRQIKNDADKLGIPVQVSKIDDSHKKLKFQNFLMAKKWLEYYIKDKTKFGAKMEEDNQMQDFAMDENDDNSNVNSNKWKGWFQLQNYKFQSFTRIRQARFLTTPELNIQELIEDTKTTSYIKFKNLIETQLLQNDEQKRAYQSASMQSQQHRRRPRNNDRYYNQTQVHYNKEYQLLERNPLYPNHTERPRNNYNHGDYQRSFRAEREGYGDRSRNQGSYRGERSYRAETSYRNDRPYRGGDRYSRNFDPSRSRNKYHQPSESPQHRGSLNRTYAQTSSNVVMQSHQMNQTQIGNQQTDQDQDERMSNFSFLLDNVHNDRGDLSLAKALNQLKLQEGTPPSLEMSIELAPQQVQQSLDLSVVLGQEDKKVDISNDMEYVEDGKGFHKGDKGDDGRSQRSGKESSHREGSQRGDRDRKDKWDKNKKAHQVFDYLKYVEEREKQSEERKVVGFKGNSEVN